MTRFTTMAIAAIIWCGLGVPSAAQGLGMKAGASFDPDQFYFGGHVETGRLADEWRFRPNVEIGLGDEVTLVGINLEFIYSFPSTREWNLYAGAGPALNIIDAEASSPASEGGLNFLAGLAHQGGLFGEVKFGALDSPRFKFAVGYTFKWR
jgi:hypothetical protein